MSQDDGLESNSNPLEDLYVDGDAFDRERIRAALSDLIGIDRDSGEPRFYKEFDELETKSQFTALLLYRRALDALDHIGEDQSVGAGSGYFAELIDVDASTIRHAASDLVFVENKEEKGGYYLPVHNINRAVALLEDDK